MMKKNFKKLFVFTLLVLVSLGVSSMAAAEGVLSPIMLEPVVGKIQMTQDVTVNIMWMDNDNACNTRPWMMSVSVRGTDGSQYSGEVMNPSKGGVDTSKRWQMTFEDLPYTNGWNGIEYSVQANAPQGYRIATNGLNVYLTLAQSPATATPAPVKSEEPVVATATPVIETPAPVASEEPVTETATPVIETPAPVASEEPVAATETPAIETPTPVASEEPVTATETPVVETPAPVASEEPVTATETPVTETPAPVASEEPVTATETPVTETPAPVASEEPVTATETLVIETPAPVASEEPVTATETPVMETPAPVASEEPVEATEAPAEETEVVTYERDANGCLVLDDNGMPVAIVPEGMDIPVEYLRDETGALVLDENGDPIPTQTVPAGSHKVDTLEDLLDPNRRIDVYASWEGDTLYFGEEMTLIAALHGYENAVYTLQWQVSADANTWTDIDGATGSSTKVLVTEENYLYYWRVQVVVTAVNGQ